MSKRKTETAITMETTKTTKPDQTGTQAETVIVEEVPTPIVIELEKKKKKKGKKKYSGGLSRSVQELESGATKSARRVAKAVREALNVYEDARDDSAEKKKDGALRDMLRNQSKALREGLPIAAQAPSDFLDAVADMKVVKRLLKR
jgi:hypothetical protein